MIAKQQYRVQDKAIARNAIAAIKGLFADAEELEQPVVVEIRPWKKDRTLAQNRLAFTWYKERAKQVHTTPEYEYQLLKLRFGCPLLLADDEDFARIFRMAIEPLNYEDRIAAMRYLPVTRLFHVKQFTQYLTDIEQESALQGVVLTHPGDIYEEAMGR